MKLGDHVVIAARNASICEAAAQELQQQHPQQQVFHTTCDVSQPDQVQQLAAFAQSKLGQIDVWVNNAGVSQIPKAPLASTSPDQVQSIIQTNMSGAILGCQAAVQVMQKQNSGQRATEPVMLVSA